jgi:hypothetical protein
MKSQRRGPPRPRPGRLDQRCALGALPRADLEDGAGGEPVGVARRICLPSSVRPRNSWTEQMRAQSSTESRSFEGARPARHNHERMNLAATESAEPPARSRDHAGACYYRAPELPERRGIAGLRRDPTGYFSRPLLLRPASARDRAGNSCDPTGSPAKVHPGNSSVYRGAQGGVTFREDHRRRCWKTRSLTAAG